MEESVSLKENGHVTAKEVNSAKEGENLSLKSRTKKQTEHTGKQTESYKCCLSS